MTINRQWLLAERPSGMVGPHNFEYAETPIPESKNNEVLVKNLFLSFDPAQRNWMVDRKAYRCASGHWRTYAGSICG